MQEQSGVGTKVAEIKDKERKNIEGMNRSWVGKDNTLSQGE